MLTRLLAALVSILIAVAPVQAQWGGRANTINAINPQVLPANASAGLPAVDDNFAAGGNPVSNGVCAEYGHQVPCTNHYSISRASTKYCQTVGGLLTQVASGAFCWTDQGLLIEEARTNIVLQSQSVDNASWTKTVGTVTADSTIAPDGTLTADTYTEIVGSGVQRIIQATSVTSGVTGAFSFYIKAGTRQFVSFGIAQSANQFWGTIDTTNGSVTSGANGTGTVVSVTSSVAANGFYRAIVIGSISGTTAYSPFVISTTTASPTAPAGVAIVGTGATWIVWGIQFEQAAFPTSYIPTTTVSVTRAADAVTSTFAFPAAQGSWVTKGFFTPLSSAQMLEGSGTSGISLGASGTNRARAIIRQGAAGRGDTNAGIGPVFAVNDSARVATSYDGATSLFSINGATQANAVTPAQADWTLPPQVGRRSTGTLYWNNYIFRLMQSPAPFGQGVLNELTQ